jgi:hypothetical protein
MSTNADVRHAVSAVGLIWTGLRPRPEAASGQRHTHEPKVGQLAAGNFSFP